MARELVRCYSSSGSEQFVAENSFAELAIKRVERVTSDIIFPFAMDNPTESNCNCNDCYFLKNKLLQEIIHNIKPSFVIDSVHMTHIVTHMKHISKKIINLNSVVNASIYLHKEFEKSHIALEIKILHNENRLEVLNLFKNEILFYKNIRSFVRFDLFPKCYLADNIANEIYQHPIIVLEDLWANGYKKQIAILDRDALCKYMRVLGLFHAETFRMKEDNSYNYKLLLKNMWFESERQRSRQEQAVSTFLNSSEMNNLLDIKLKREITEKLQKVKHLEKCTYSTIIHGSFTRDVVVMKENIVDDMKIIGFQKIRVGPPVIDVGRILLTNLPNMYHVTSLKIFFSDMMKMYLNSLREEYPMIGATNCKWLKREIYNNLLFSYINLENDERYTIRDSHTILKFLNQLCKY